MKTSENASRNVSRDVTLQKKNFFFAGMSIINDGAQKVSNLQQGILKRRINHSTRKHNFPTSLTKLINQNMRFRRSTEQQKPTTSAASRKSFSVNSYLKILKTRSLFTSA